MLACLAGLVVWDRSALAASLRAILHLHWAWLAAALAPQVVSLLAAAGGHRRLLAEAGARVRLRRVLAISTASGAIASTVPLAGLQTAAAYSFRQYHRRGVGLGISGWAFTVAWMLATLSLAAVVGVGAAVSGNLLAATAGVVTSVAFLVPPLALLLAVRFPAVRRILNRVTVRLMTLCRRLVGRPRTDLARALDEQLTRMAGIRLRPATGAAVFGFELAYWLADVASLICAIRATGVPVPWHGLLLAYGAGVAASGLGLTPGGIGLVEAGLSAALVAAGMHAAPALTVALAYRLVGFWLPLGAGWVTIALLAREVAPDGAASPAERALPGAA